MDYEGRLQLRRAFGVIVPLGLIALALVVGRDVWSGSVSAASTPTVTSSPSVSGSVTPPPTPTPTLQPSPSSTGSSDPSTSQGPPTTAPPTSAGIVLAALPTSSGAVEVSEQVLLDVPVTSINLAPPEVAAAGIDFAGLAPRAVEVQLIVDGQPVRMPSSTVDAPMRVALAMPANRFELRYVLENTTVRSIPSSSGRALVAVAPLSRNSGDNDPVVLEADTASVLNLTCPEVAELRTVCAEGSTGRLRTQSGLQVVNALVVLQSDLPRP